LEFPLSNDSAADPFGGNSQLDDFWSFNPEQPLTLNTPAMNDDTSLDELLALYQSPQDAVPPNAFGDLNFQEKPTTLPFPTDDPFASFGSSNDRNVGPGDFAAVDDPFADIFNFDSQAANGPVFPPLEALSQDALMEFPAFDAGDGPVFPPLEALSQDALMEFPAFDAGDGPVFPPLEALSQDALMEFPAFDAGDGPVFPPLEASSQDALMEFPAFDAGDGPVFPPLEALSQDALMEFPAFDAGDGPVVAVEREEFVAIAQQQVMNDEFVATLRQEVEDRFEQDSLTASSMALPVQDLSAVDPDETLRFTEVTIPHTVGVLSSAVIPAVKTRDDRLSAAQTASQAIAGIHATLGEVQTNLTDLYANLQRAAVRRASVPELAVLTEQIALNRSKIAQDSETYQQALYLRALADAYLQLFNEL
jgi:hypothetical protein